MSVRAAIEEMKEVLVEEAAIGAVGLWAVLWDVKHQFPGLSPQETKTATLRLVREAVREGRIVAGRVVRDGDVTRTFVPWQLPPDEVVARIEAEWSALGRAPNLGDIVELVSPDLLPFAARPRS
jgi:hypothetical protein